MRRRRAAGRPAPLLGMALRQLGAPWSVFTDLRLETPAGPIAADYVLVHPDCGIALLDCTPEGRAGPSPADALRTYLEAGGIAEFFPGYLPIVCLCVDPDDSTGLAGRISDAFAGVPLLTVKDRDWAQSVATVLTGAEPVGTPPKTAERDRPPPAAGPAPTPASRPRPVPRPDSLPKHDPISVGLRAGERVVVSALAPLRERRLGRWAAGIAILAVGAVATAAVWRAAPPQDREVGSSRPSAATVAVAPPQQDSSAAPARQGAAALAVPPSENRLGPAALPPIPPPPDGAPDLARQGETAVPTVPPAGRALGPAPQRATAPAVAPPPPAPPPVLDISRTIAARPVIVGRPAGGDRGALPSAPALAEGTPERGPLGPLDALTTVVPSEPPIFSPPPVRARDQVERRTSVGATKPRRDPGAAVARASSPRSDKAREGRRPATPGDGPPIDAADLPPLEPGTGSGN